VSAHARAVDRTGEECGAAQHASVTLLAAVLEKVGGAEREARAKNQGVREASTARCHDLDDAAQIFSVSRRVEEGGAKFHTSAGTWVEDSDTSTHGLQSYRRALNVD
jgi:hypothetical protein